MERIAIPTLTRPSRGDVLEGVHLYMHTIPQSKPVEDVISHDASRRVTGDLEAWRQALHAAIRGGERADALAQFWRAETERLQIDRNRTYGGAARRDSYLERRHLMRSAATIGEQLSQALGEEMAAIRIARAARQEMNRLLDAGPVRERKF